MNASDNIGLTDFLVLVYIFFKRNIIILGLATIIGFAIGTIYTLKKPDYYYSEMVGFSNIIKETSLLEILSPLTTLVGEKNYTELSIRLEIPLEKASQIRSLTFANSKHTKTSHAPKATDEKLGELIVVTTEVYDKEALETIEQGILNYLNSNAYIKSSKNLELQKTENLITETSKNIHLIDSLNTHSQDNNSNIYIQEINPIDYQEAYLEVENLKISAQTLKAFTVISGFYKLDKPANRSLLIKTAITLAFLTLGMVIVFLKELARLAKD